MIIRSSRAPLLCIALAIVYSLVVLGSPLRAEEPFDLREIAQGVFVHQGRDEVFSPGNEGDIANIGFVVGDSAVAVIDTGGSARVGERLREVIRKVTPLPVRYVINTHMHPDHVFGNVAFLADAPDIVGHGKLPRALATRAQRYLAANEDLLGPEAFAGTRIVPPTSGVGGERRIDLGGRTLLLRAWPTAHTDNDLTVLDEKTGTLFTGDLLFVRHIPTLDGSLTGWLAAIAALSEIKAQRAVPGHGPVSVDWPGALDAERRYLETLERDTRKAIEAGQSLADSAREAAQSERGAWALFDEYNGRNASAAFAELEWK
jgi:quinoprotein relay system zinc metallohydrolase 2